MFVELHYLVSGEPIDETVNSLKHSYECRSVFEELETLEAEDENSQMNVETCKCDVDL